MCLNKCYLLLLMMLNGKHLAKERIGSYTSLLRV